LKLKKYSEMEKFMDGVTIVSHPLVQHKLTLIRDKARSTKGFRELLNEIGTLLCYEVTRDLPLADIEIETPVAKMTGKQIAGKKLVFAPILRAGLSFVEGMINLVPSARIAHIGLYRDPETFVAVEYFFKAPLNRQHRSGGDRPDQGARRKGYPLRLPAGVARRHRAAARRASGRADLDRCSGRSSRRARIYRPRPGRCRRPRLRNKVAFFAGGLAPLRVTHHRLNESKHGGGLRRKRA
jgi:hypothetical protein